MSSETDPVVDDVLRSAHAAASPAPAELARALAGIRQRIALPELSLGEQDAARRGAERAASRAGRSARWSAELRRLFGTGLALGVGFALGVQYERRREPTQPAAALQSAPPERVGTRLQTVRPAAAVPVPVPEAESTQTPAPALDPAEPGRQAAGLARVARPKDAATVVRTSHASQRAATRHGGGSARKHADPPLPSATEPSRFGFAEVVTRVERAQHAQRDHRPELAIELLDEVDARADETTLREERLVTRVLADCDLGNVSAAQHALGELQSSAEAAVYASRIASSCVAPDVPGARPSSTIR